MRSTEVALQRSNPEEARRASRGVCIDFLGEERIFVEETAVSPVSPGILPHLALHEDFFLVASPGVFAPGT